MRFVTNIVQIKDVKAGETIGYGPSIVEKDTTTDNYSSGYNSASTDKEKVLKKEVEIYGKGSPIN